MRSDFAILQRAAARFSSLVALVGAITTFLLLLLDSSSSSFSLLPLPLPSLLWSSTPSCSRLAPSTTTPSLSSLDNASVSTDTTMISRTSPSLLQPSSSSPSTPFRPIQLADASLLMPDVVSSWFQTKILRRPPASTNVTTTSTKKKKPNKKKKKGNNNNTTDGKRKRKSKETSGSSSKPGREAEASNNKMTAKQQRQYDKQQEAKRKAEEARINAAIDAYLDEDFNLEALDMDELDPRMQERLYTRRSVRLAEYQRKEKIRRRINYVLNPPHLGSLLSFKSTVMFYYRLVKRLSRFVRQQYFLYLERHDMLDYY